METKISYLDGVNESKQKMNASLVNFSIVPLKESQDSSGIDVNFHNLISKIIFWPYISYSYQLYLKIIKQKQKIRSSHILKFQYGPNLKYSFFLIGKQIKQEYNSKKIISNWSLSKIIFLGPLRSHVILSLFVLMVQSICKCSISIILSLILNCAQDGEIEQANYYAIGFVVLNLIALLCFNHGLYQAEIFSSKCRMVLINCVYCKMIKLSSCTLTELNIGKLLNMISTDITVLESLLPLFLQALMAPITLLFVSIILWIQFEGPIGLLAIVILFITYPLQIVIQSQNFKTIWIAKRKGDQRIKLTNELIEGIRIIKMYVWETSLKQMISEVRNVELNNYMKTKLKESLDRTISLASPYWGSTVYFIILYYWEYQEFITVPKIIMVISLLTFAKYACVLYVSIGLYAFTMVKISIERITNLLNKSDIQIASIDQEQEIQESEFDIELKNLNAYWSITTKDKIPTLTAINLQIKSGELWAIIGRVGCGKSTLLNLILKELPAYSGSMLIKADKIAFVEQEPFIFPDTIRNNILFGREYDDDLYQSVVEASCLEQDIIQMKYQDFTEISEKGVTLSGGQKARLCLARALYQMADIYLFDDPLSAVDSGVAKAIFNHAIKDFIYSKQIQMQPDRKAPIVILVTHQIQYAIKCDKIGILKDGQIIAQGTYNEVKHHVDLVVEEIISSKNLQLNKKQKVTEKFKTDITKNCVCQKAEEFQQEISFSTYKRYFSYWNGIVIILILLLNVFSEALLNIYLRIVSIFQEFFKIEDYFLFTSLLIICYLFINLIKYSLNIMMIKKTSKKLHEDMMNSLIKAPVSYFDLHPSGQIINKFSNDLSLSDTQTIQVLFDIQELIFNFLIALITIAILEPYFIIITVFVIVSDVVLFSINKQVILQLKAIELISRSPIFDFLKKTVNGVTQVRVYKQQDWFKHQYFLLTDHCNNSNLAYYSTSRAFMFSIDFIGWIVQALGVFLILNFGTSGSGGQSQALLLLTIFNDGINWGLKKLILFESQMASYNRIFELIDIQSEKPHQLPTDEKISYPKDGSIQFKDVSMKYRSNLELSLKCLNFTIESGQRIGCVGRTGSGKSSILQVLFRLVEIEETKNSQLMIGGIDIRTLGLSKLRQSISIIPQSPFLFTGTVRRNLDPFDHYTDSQVWQALQDTDLKDAVNQLKEGLNTEISCGNSVFSVGQKQLICLARALLNKKKIIVLDEATANVDMETDNFIQSTLKNKFKECTLITIAHRLNTIADYDKVIVMDEGKVIQFGSPFELLALNNSSIQIDRDSAFARLVKNTGEHNSQMIFEIAKNKERVICSE